MTDNKQPDLNAPIFKHFTRKDFIDGIRISYEKMLEFEQSQDPSITRFPDMDDVLDYIEEFGIPPLVPTPTEREKKLEEALRLLILDTEFLIEERGYTKSDIEYALKQARAALEGEG